MSENPTQIIAQRVAQGARVESQTDFQAVMGTGGEKRTVLAVDDYGNIQRR